MLSQPCTKHCKSLREVVFWKLWDSRRIIASTGRVILNSRANQFLSDREITYLLRDIDRKRDTADMRSEAKQRERREKRQKRKQESKERVFLKPFLKKRNK